MIEICVTLNEGEGEHNQHVMHSETEAVTVSKLIDVASLVSDGQTDIHTNRQTTCLRVRKPFQSHIKLGKEK